jgi:hypothetical protein
MMFSTCLTNHHPVLATILVLILGAVGSANASTVRQVSFDELVARSELVFHGRVIRVQSQQAPDTQSIYTEVEFQIIEQLIGQVPGDTLKLIFPGGQKDGIKIVVHGLKLPQHGEEGVYFVENTSQRMVNPFYGWTQGQFLVTRDAQEQIPRILTADGSPVLRISPAVAPTAVSISRGSALGVESSRGGPVSAAMSLNDFRQAILVTAERTR